MRSWSQRMSPQVKFWSSDGTRTPVKHVPAVHPEFDCFYVYPTVLLNGVELYFEVHGSGEPLVLLHGFSGSSQDWRASIPGWGPNFQIILPDLRGHGRSSLLLKPFRHEEAELSIEMAKAIPQSSLWVIPNRGHGPVIGESWPEFLKTAVAFVRE